jgi:hypothetical protein
MTFKYLMTVFLSPYKFVFTLLTARHSNILLSTHRVHFMSCVVLSKKHHFFSTRRWKICLLLTRSKYFYPEVLTISLNEIHVKLPHPKCFTWSSSVQIVGPLLKGPTVQQQAWTLANHADLQLKRLNIHSTINIVCFIFTNLYIRVHSI